MSKILTWLVLLAVIVGEVFTGDFSFPAEDGLINALDNSVKSGVKTVKKTFRDLTYGQQQFSSAKADPCRTHPDWPIKNAGLNCINNRCQIKCIKQYEFPNKETQLSLTCANGEWEIERTEWTEVPPCKPICMTPCQNQGICISPNRCACPDNYIGTFCEKKKQFCPSQPRLPKNSEIRIQATTCTITCRRGYTFPDQTAVANMECRDGQWHPSRPDLTAIPDCEPTCTPPCQSGGKCLSLNFCQCPPERRGGLCQFDKNVCNPKERLGFNGIYNCSGDALEMKCDISCPLGIKLSAPATNPYVCKYERGQYQPVNVPQCIFPPGMQIMPLQESSHSFYSNRSSSSSSSAASSQSSRRRRKKIIVQSGDEEEGEDESYERIITKTKIEIKHRKKPRTKTANQEYYEYEDEEEQSYSDAEQQSGVYSMYLSGGVSVQMRTPQSATCSAWNGNKVKTFDGLIYTAPLRCSHTLVQDIKDGTFSVVLRSCPSGGISCNSTAIEVIMDVKRFTFEVTAGELSVLSQDRRKLPMPLQRPEIRAALLGHRLQVQLDSIGVTVYWNLEQMVTVETTAALWNRTGGLCGTLDADDKNDFRTKDGTIVKTANSFVDSWATPLLDVDPKQCGSSEYTIQANLTCSEARRVDGERICLQLIESDKFTNCLKLVNKRAFVQSCVSDYCSCNVVGNPEKCACNSAAVLASDCQFRGVVFPQGWRNLNVCPVTCPRGETFRACGPVFEPFCGSTVDEVNAVCNEGCFCPDGMLRSAGVCVYPESCPCSLRGKVFQPKQTIRKDCNTCQCVRGVWSCSDHTCGARCGAVGDPHYRTFDNKRFDFQGKCSYVLMKTANVTVEAENIACSGQISADQQFASVDQPSCTKSVTIRLTNGPRVEKVQLGQGRVVTINDQTLKRVPIKLFDGKLHIREASSFMLLVTLLDGLQVWWDGQTNAYIDAPAAYRNRTSGLCGTFNANSQDDFLTPDGDVESAVAAFANKWQTKETCPFVDNDQDIPHPCQVNIENKDRALKVCEVLRSELFGECHFYVEPAEFYDDCVYDMCACTGLDISNCLCPVLSAYASQCAQQGIALNWRHSVNECAIKCPVGQVFEECGDSCYRSCADRQFNEPCRKTCVEGCRCPAGQSLNDNGECVSTDLCPCLYDGQHFKAGYKEVRSGSKYLELCTCKGASWHCIQAQDGDEIRHPRSADIRLQCLNDTNSEFVTCRQTVPLSCKNMHNFQPIPTIDCQSGCACKKGFVLDAFTNRCILPESCGCHHGGKSYPSGSLIKDECNDCRCHDGSWTCTKLQCPATCTAWGDSHFESFDGKDFDFQGVCSYVLSKGSLASGQSYAITIQNVLCGSLGVTCSKSVSISILGEHKETITLVASSGHERTAAEARAGNSQMLVYDAGVFTVVELIGLDVQVKWDRGTRVYIRVGNGWRGLVKGLCGNFNGDAEDDLKTPAKGIEASSTIFGNSWKLEDYCEKPKDQIDTCAAHPERKVWSQRQCGILKSDVFKACHSEVNVDRYMRLCVYDTCACDQGGDCECLCTAVAAYAHACSMKGVAIRWRTPSMCPMQCDAHCSEYTPCLSSACPVETCDESNGGGGGGIATQQLQTPNPSCATDTCVEGCQLKPCPQGQIYRNSTYTECVPRSTCRPLCQRVGNVNYYEGDILASDACHTCRCSRGQSVCSGVPCTVPAQLTTTTTTKPSTGTWSTTTTTTAQPWMDSGYKCQPGWSSWINQDALGGTTKSSPSTRKNGDREPLPNEILLNNLPAKSASCRTDQMSDIECRSVGSHRDHKQLGENVECSLERGLLAIGLCSDYEIRVFCSCGPVTVKPPTVREDIRKPPPRPKCDPSQPLTEHPDDCHKYLECELSGNTWAYAEKLCPATTMFNPVSLICDWPLAVQEVKPQCTFRRPHTPVDQEVEYIPLTTPRANVREEIPSDCNPGAPNREFNGDCARFWQCDQNAGGSWRYVAKMCGPGTMYNPSNMICDWPAAVQKVRPECGAQPIVVVPPPVNPTIPVVQHQPGGPCDANTPNVEYPGDCQRFLQCLFGSNGGWTFVEKSCGLGTMFNPVAMICDWPLAVQEVKPECGARRPHTTKAPATAENQSRCPSGQLWRSATVQCNATCHYYLNARLRPQRQCRSPYETLQLDYCVPLAEAQSSCGWGRVWREDNVCTEKAHCTCMTRGGEMLKPGAIYKESECEVCQCTNNDYVCDKSRCSTNSTSTVPVPTKPTTREEILIVVDSTRSPPTKCERSRMIPIINGIQPLPDSIFIASTSKDITHEPKFARLSPKSSSDSNFWMPQTSDAAQYLKIALPKPTPIYGIVVRGSNNEYDLFVTSFKVVYSFDDIVYHPVVLSGTAQTFRGPIDAASPVETLFGTPIEAKYVRIYPLTWNTDIALQAELLGCDIYPSTTVRPQPIIETSTRLPTTHVNIIVDTPFCDDPMGVDDGRLLPQNIKFSSVKLPAGSVRLSSTTSAGWQPQLNTQLEYVVVDFLESRVLTGLSTRGGNAGWVTSFVLKYSMDGRVWNAYEDNTRHVKSFLANYDGVSVKTNYFEKPINARFIRVVPTNWHSTIELKLEPIGCFKAYPKSNTTDIVIEEPDSVCGLCPGVLPSANVIPGSCYCNPPLQWNGQSCVEGILCPCMVGHISYDVGATYQLNDCSECTCLIGGHAQCAPFACPPCKSGLRSVKSAPCACRCEPCRTGDVLCPSSGVCIPETSWCDGIVDCPDDELFCSDVRNSNTTVKVIEKTVITRTCPKAVCPPGYTIKFLNNGTASSQSDESLSSIKYTTKTKTTMKISDPNANAPAKWQLPTPKNAKPTELPADLAAQCVKFKCIPLQADAYEVHRPTAGGACPLPKCPIGYNVLMESTNSGTACGNFSCKPDETQTERVCNVSGRSFVTFDGTAFKYDICNHILARDLVANQWSIAAAKNCELGNNTCTKSLLIRDADDTTTITLLQNLQVQIDHYTFTMLQLQQSNHPKLRAYVISRVGNTLVVRSHRYGFWLTFNQFAEVRIGLTDRHRTTVDGLCGYFNGIAADDRRTPSGTVLLSTDDFGDSWSLNGTQNDACEPHKCPRDLHAAALDLCNNIRSPSFAVCAPLVDAAGFIERCIEFACECLRPSAVLDVRSADQPALAGADQCKCDVLQQYALACLAADAAVHLDRWRAVHECAATKCPVGMVYQDCSRRQCEPTCAPRTAASAPVSERCEETVGSDAATCYPGCYCPTGQLRQGDRCIEPAECADCTCHGDDNGNTAVSTFDGTVQPLRDGDCTVLLSRGGGGALKGVTFEVYVRFGPCADGDQTAHRCVQAFYLFAGGDAAHIRLDAVTNRLTVNDAPVVGVQDLGWLRASRSPASNEWLVRLPKAQIELRFDSRSYELRVPSVRYGTSLDGWCGNCNGNPADDGISTKISGVAALQSSALLAKQPETWRRQLTAAATAKCTEIIEETNEVEQPCSKRLTPDPCAALLDVRVFGRCHFIVSPQQFVAECQAEVCRNDDAQRTCQHIARYAAACRRNAICIDTANVTGLSSYARCSPLPTVVCPSGMRYESCGCPLTCAHLADRTTALRSCPVRPIAGCVCADGYVFAQADGTGECVPERACRTCDAQGHRVGDRWTTDACTECVCGDDGRTQCVRKQCATLEECERGFVRRELSAVSGECCARSVCEPTSAGGAPVCPVETTVPVACGENQEVRALRDAQGCVNHVCDCVPPGRCPPLESVHLYEGQTILTDATGCCPVHRLRCDKTKCEAAAQTQQCPTRFHETYAIVDNSTVCCAKQGCRPPKDKCIVRDAAGVVSAKRVLEMWPTSDPCRSKRCAYDSAGVPTVVEDVVTCPKMKCAAGWTMQTDAQKCCPTCQQATCVLNGNVLVAVGESVRSADNCTVHTCSKQTGAFLFTSVAERCPDIGACPANMRYVSGCCELCKAAPLVQDQVACLATTLSPADTVKLVEKKTVKYGMCRNPKPIEGFTECNGACRSGTSYDKATFKQAKQCDCCQVDQQQTITVPLVCDTGATLDVAISIPKTCRCLPCEGETVLARSAPLINEVKPV